MATQTIYILYDLDWNHTGVCAAQGGLSASEWFRGTHIHPTPSQNMVDTAPTFPEVILKFKKWMEEEGLINEDDEVIEKYCWCTDGVSVLV